MWALWVQPGQDRHHHLPDGSDVAGCCWHSLPLPSDISSHVPSSRKPSLAPGWACTSSGLPTAGLPTLGHYYPAMNHELCEGNNAAVGHCCVLRITRHRAGAQEMDQPIHCWALSAGEGQVSAIWHQHGGRGARQGSSGTNNGVDPIAKQGWSRTLVLTFVTQPLPHYSSDLKGQPLRRVAGGQELVAEVAPGTVAVFLGDEE